VTERKLEPVPTGHTELRVDSVTVNRPTLDSGVELVGEFQGSGFAERQWLITRGDRFIQVTELLYRIAEHADGERTVEEIAEAVTEATEWLVTPQNVHDLIESRLIPLGVIGADATAPATTQSPARSETTRSPFALNMRVRAIRPAAIEPVARVLQYLFTPPVAIVALVAAVAAHVWVYRFRGLTSAFIDALYRPSSLIIVLGVALLGAIVHEFGHASGLRYGGARARGMGFGLYMIFPAFFTDVTESYRLGRWGRVRTGLGGPYFHLLFAAALIGIAVASGYEFLLIAVLLINIEIARQFVPFVRLDGYWVLADLTGVPDFLSQMGPFVRSLFPRLAQGGTRLPRLKPWVKAVFAAYILLIVPTLIALLVLLIRFLPRLLTLLWDAAATQLNFLTVAFAERDWIGSATSLVELVILGLPILGLGYLLYSLTARPLVLVARQPTWRRRGVGLAALAAMIAVIGFVWAPQLPFAGNTRPAGVKSFDVENRTHTRAAVSYPQSPPVGGAHSPVWQNCGFYVAPVANENAVHSLEHGAVWLAYRPDLPASEVDELRDLAHRQTYVLVSPVRGLSSPVVASAWGNQLALASTSDARLDRFVELFRLNNRAPESGGPCTGGKGRPQ
jgi:putative peptide zinc metalloprotease protein